MVGATGFEARASSVGFLGLSRFPVKVCCLRADFRRGKPVCKRIIQRGGHCFSVAAVCLFHSIFRGFSSGNVPSGNSRGNCLISIEAGRGGGLFGRKTECDFPSQRPASGRKWSADSSRNESGNALRPEKHLSGRNLRCLTAGSSARWAEFPSKRTFSDAEGRTEKPQPQS